MIRILIVVGALLLGLIFAPELSDNKGYLLISFDSYTTYETTIVNAAFIAILFYVLLLAAEWLLRKLLSMSSVTRGWLGQRKMRKAQKNSLLGMLALLEGNPKQAQKLLAKSAAKSDTPAMSYIAAARAAHQNREYDQRDDFLQLASERPRCQLAVGLLWAELQLDAQQYENALATLKDLDQHFPKNRAICTLFMKTYQALDDGQELINLLRSHRKLIDLDEKALSELEFEAHQKLFKQLAAESGQSLDDYWHKKLARWMRKELQYQRAFIDACIEYGEDKTALTFLMEKLQKQFSLPLLPYLQKLQLNDYYPAITLLEKHLKKSQHEDYVHQALAYLKVQEGHIEAAANHLIESVKTLPSIADYKLLTSLLEQQDKQEQANHYYREALLFANRAD